MAYHYADLESLSKGVNKTPRTASAGEKSWLIDVVAKYRDDFEAASRDRKLNPWQRTAGEIKRSYVPYLILGHVQVSNVAWQCRKGWRYSKAFSVASRDRGSWDVCCIFTILAF